MNSGSSVLFFFSALGAFNGFVLSFYFWFFVKPKSPANFFMGSLLLALSVRIGKSVLYYFNPELPKLYLQIGLSACFLIGPALYFYLRSATQQLTKISQPWKWTIALWLTIMVVVGAIYPYQRFPKMWSQYFVEIIYWQWLAYVLASAYVLRDIGRKLFQKGVSLSGFERWLLSIFVGNLLICLQFLFVYYGVYSLYINGPLLFTFMLYLMLFLFVNRKKMNFVLKKPSDKYANKKISEAEAMTLMSKLKNLMETEKSYQNASLKLGDVAGELAISKHQLSQLLNDNLGKSFSSFINEYRVEAACEQLLSADHLTLEAIGYEVGFNSKSTFYSTFKRLMGETPSAYKKRLAQL